MASVSASLEWQSSGLIVDWSVYGLGNDFSPDYYTCVGISISPITDGSTSVSGTIAEKASTWNSSGTHVYGGAHPFPYDTPGATYTIYGYAQVGYSGGYKYYSAGSVRVTVPQKPSTRPDDWCWSTSGIRAGGAMNYTQSGNTITPRPLTATEWRNFISRIQEFAEHVGVSLNSTYLSRATSGVSQGSPMTVTQANAALFLINQLDPPLETPDPVVSGGRITAAFINGLMYSLNSIE